MQYYAVHIQFYNRNISQVCFLVIISHLYNLHIHSTNLKLLRLYSMKGLTPILDPHPTAKRFFFIKSRNDVFITKQSGVLLVCHWVEAELSEYNLWHELYFGEINLITAFLKHYTKFKINSSTFFLCKKSNFSLHHKH